MQLLKAILKTFIQNYYQEYDGYYLAILPFDLSVNRKIKGRHNFIGLNTTSDEIKIWVKKNILLSFKSLQNSNGENYLYDYQIAQWKTRNPETNVQKSLIEQIDIIDLDQKDIKFKKIEEGKYNFHLLFKEINLSNYLLSKLWKKGQLELIEYISFILFKMSLQ